MKHDHFTDDRIAALCSGEAMMTAEERVFLVSDTPRMEECPYSQEALEAMPDAQLMEVDCFK